MGTPLERHWFVAVLLLESSIMEGWSDPSVDIQFRLLRAADADTATPRHHSPFVLVDQRADSRMCLLPGCPHRCRPLHDGRISFAAWRLTKHLCNGDAPAVCGRIERGPLLRSTGEVHVRPLDGFPGVTSFEKQVEADQGECNGHRL